MPFALLDKTFGKLSNGPDSISRRPTNGARPSALELKESWEDLERERSTIQLSTVVDTSFEEPLRSPAPQPEPQPQAAQTFKSHEGDDTIEAARLRKWIEGIERACPHSFMSIERLC